MSKQKTVLLIVLLIVIIGVTALNVFVFLEKKKVVKSPEEIEIMKEEVLKFAEVMWKNPAEPMQSLPIKESEIPGEAIRLSISEGGFIPSVFEVETGQKVVLAVSSQDGKGHILKFNDESLSKVAIGVAPAETRIITFFAPQEPGEYEFFCLLLSHAERGEKGKMEKGKMVVRQ